MFLRVGSLKRSSGGTTVDVTRQVGSPDSDLALLKLAEPVEVTPSTLADSGPDAGDTNRIFGWGRTKKDFSSPASEELKTATVTVRDVGSGCTDGDGAPAICSDGDSGYAWSGDSGGPEFANGVQVGVASTASLNRDAQTYGSVPANRAWIREVSGV